MKKFTHGEIQMNNKHADTFEDEDGLENALSVEMDRHMWNAQAETMGVSLDVADQRFDHLQKSISRAQNQTIADFRKALDEIAAWGDDAANRQLKATGSYGAFNEPNAVRIARETLEKCE